MAKMVNFGKIQFQISGQWFELGGSYFQVKITSPKASIGDVVFENSFLTHPILGFTEYQNIKHLGASRVLETYFKIIIESKKSLPQNLCRYFLVCWEL